MTIIHDYYTIALIAWLAALSPGPDFVVVAKNAISHGRKSAIMTSLGIGSGILIHATYCVLGLAIIISQSLLIFSLIKYLGASYLIYLGIKSLLSRNNHKINLAQQVLTTQSIWTSYYNGLLTNVLNPKCTLFMLSIFTLLVKPHTPIFTQSIYAFEIIFITTTWFIFLSSLLTHTMLKRKISAIQHIATKLMGGLLVILGIVVVFESC